MDEYLELLNELGLTEEDNKDECEDLAHALFADGLLDEDELEETLDRLESIG
jgi:hypothetical protein